LFFLFELNNLTLRRFVPKISVDQREKKKMGSRR